MDGTKCFVVVVDDDHRKREALKDLLKSAGYNVPVFASAEMFLESQIMNDGNCVASDIRMSGMSGFELSEHIQSIDPDLPVILISSDPEPECLRRSTIVQRRVIDPPLWRGHLTQLHPAEEAAGNFPLDRTYDGTVWP